MNIPVGVSARHVHVSQEHLEQLFGPGATLHKYKDLSQPGQFAAEETVDLQGPKGTIRHVRVLGPVRPHTQVEVANTDALKLGLKPPVRESGDILGTPGVTLVGPQGQVELPFGVIVAQRHIHFSEQDAAEFDVQNGDELTVRGEGSRSVIFEHVVARVSPSYALDFHIDTDEANAAGLRTGDDVELVEMEIEDDHFHGNDIIRADSSGTARNSADLV